MKVSRVQATLSKPKPKLAYGYVRVSTSMQVEDGVSLETQSLKITEYCDYKGYTLVHIYEDAGISGGHTDRPGLNNLLDVLRKDNYLVVAELNRLSRNSSDAIRIHTQLKEKGSILVSLNPDIDFSTPAGEMMFTILMGFYQLERRQISERVSTNMQSLSSQGLLRGRPCYGWKCISRNKAFEEVPEQQEVIKIVVKLYEDKVSMRGIADYLNRNGYNKTLPRKKEAIELPLFYGETIKCILRNQGFAFKNGVKKKPYIGSRVEEKSKNNSNSNVSNTDGEGGDNLT